jgi:signal peptidase I
MSKKKKIKKSSFVSEFIDLVKMIVISFIIVTVLTTWFIKPIRVKGESMYPTLDDGSLALSGIINMINGIERFDVVTVYQDYKDQYLIKRVIGLPNDTIEFKANNLYINNELVEQSFLKKEYTDNFSEFTNDFKIVLTEDQYFLMGDNRPNSSDSRVYGPFEIEQITSEDVFVLYPFSNFGGVK